MKQNDVRRMAGFVLGAAVCAVLQLTLLSMSMCALAVLMGKLPAEQIDLWADLCLAAGSLFAAFFAARHASLFRPYGGWRQVDCCFRLSGSLESRVVWRAGACSAPAHNAIIALACAAGGVRSVKTARRRKHRK